MQMHMKMGLGLWFLLFLVSEWLKKGVWVRKNEGKVPSL